MFNLPKISKPIEKPPTGIVRFTEHALAKLTSLIIFADKEVAWHGFGEKVDKGIYIIDDIIIYPQAVGPSTVRVDELEYSKWNVNMCCNQTEKFDRMCLHGHSHVNMGTSPSATDLDLQHDVIDMIPKDGFYIFMIMNKSFDINFKIVDNADGLVYTTPNIKLGTTNKVLSDLVKEYREMVRYNTSTVYNTVKYNGGSYGHK